MQLPWQGRLTRQNFKDVGNTIFRMIGHKAYTFITKRPNEKPSVQVNLFLESGKEYSPLSFFDTGFLFSDSYGTWSCSFLDNVEIVLTENHISIVTTNRNGNDTYWTIYLSES